MGFDQFHHITHSIEYWLSEHPSILTFRWSPTQSWGSTWSFLFSSISAYIIAASFLHLTLLIFQRRRPVPLGPLPAIHSLSMTLISTLIFSGILLSASAEIRDTRWQWRRTKTTPFQWFLCFPIGTRPSGRVFFWSYMFYLSRFLHLLRTFFTVLRHRRLPLLRVFNHSMLLIMSFLWLEFSQSFQVLGILLATLLYSVIYGHRFLTEVGLRKGRFPLVVSNCQLVVFACNLVCHIGVLSLHIMGGGCNGIGAWVFNSVLNGASLALFFKLYVNNKNINMHLGKGELANTEVLKGQRQGGGSLSSSGLSESHFGVNPCDMNCVCE